jgi:small-conductance mechanosensitive channel
VNYFFDHTFHILFIATLFWMIISLVPIAEDVVLSRYNILDRGNLGARKIHTQIQMIRKVLTAVLSVLAVGYILMRFDQFRRLGAGILASAGFASLIVGLAAQKIFANFLAGIQIAFTQPIRLDDVVVVEKEWGGSAR